MFSTSRSSSSANESKERTRVRAHTFARSLIIFAEALFARFAFSSLWLARPELVHLQERTVQIRLNTFRSKGEEQEEGEETERKREREGLRRVGGNSLSYDPTVFERGRNWR